MRWPWSRPTPAELYRKAQAAWAEWWESIDDYSQPDDFYEIRHGTGTLFLFSAKSPARAQAEHMNRHGCLMESSVSCFWAAGGEHFNPDRDLAEAWVRHKRTRNGNIIPDFLAGTHEAVGHFAEDYFRRSGFQGIVTPDKSPDEVYYD